MIHDGYDVFVLYLRRSFIPYVVMSSQVRLLAYLVLCRLLQMVLDLTNREFLLILLIGTVVIFIITSVTHMHDIPADEAALKAAEKVEKSLEKIGKKDQKRSDTAETSPSSSGHKAPKGF